MARRIGRVLGLVAAVWLVGGLLASCADDSSVQAVGSGAGPSPSVSTPLPSIIVPSATPSLNTANTAVATTSPITATSVAPTASSIANSPTPTATPGPMGTDKLVATTGCGKASNNMKLGESVEATVAINPTLARGQKERSYRVFLPTSYKPDVPSALVLVFHGYSGNAAGMEGYSGFSRSAEKHNFIAVYPQGLQDDDRQPFWASIGPYDYGIEESVFVSHLLDKLQSELCVDARQIYATGFSNGGAMSYYLACTMASRIAAFAPVAGNYFAITRGCQPSRPVPILEIHGDADNVVPYKGRTGQQAGYWPLVSVSQWLQEWVRRDGCSDTSTTILQDKSVVGTQWPDCKGGTTVVHYRIINGEHNWPGFIGAREVNEVIWDFLHSYRLPEANP